MNITLKMYENETDIALSLIKGFWKEHNGYAQPTEEAMQDLAAWTSPGHQLYLIEKDGEPVGLLHLGSRGGAADWLEDLYVMPQHQGQGIGSRAIQLAEDMVKTYSESLYIEAAARNEQAIRLYRRLGYDCLNTITIRKDFHPDKFEVLRTEQVCGQPLEIRRRS